MSSAKPTTAKIRSAQRLARTIASDILLYNREKIAEGLKRDALFEVLESEIREGRELYDSRVSAELDARFHFLERALVDVLIQGTVQTECDLW